MVSSSSGCATTKTTTGSVEPVSAVALSGSAVSSTEAATVAAVSSDEQAVRLRAKAADYCKQEGGRFPHVCGLFSGL
jgi:hypothetical protein